MSADRFFIDEDLLGLAKTWGAARNDCCWPGHGCDVRLGDKDNEWVPLVASLDMVAITRDRKLSTRPAEIELVLEHRLRMIRLTTGRRPRTVMELADRLDRHWRRIERFVADRSKGPWLLTVSESDVAEVGIGPRSPGRARTIE